MRLRLGETRTVPVQKSNDLATPLAPSLRAVYPVSSNESAVTVAATFDGVNQTTITFTAVGYGSSWITLNASEDGSLEVGKELVEVVPADQPVFHLGNG